MMNAGRFRRTGALVTAALALAANGCALEHPDWIAVGHRGMVATDSPYASRVGLRVLKAGGNAVDAATAVSFALAVTRPYSTGLGGGGFLILRLGATGETRAFDFRECAPGASTRDMYVKPAARERHGTRPSRNGFLAVGVPGMVAGRVHVLNRYGSKPLAELIAPAIKLARNGFRVDSDYVKTCRNVLETYASEPRLIESCNYVYRTHLREGKLRHVGDRLVQPELARLLEAVAVGGADVFYRGEVADALVDAVRHNGGIITRGDLRRYRVIEREPILATYRDYDLILMPPPSSGGVCLAEALNILETVDLPTVAQSDRSLTTHYVVEALKHAFADRARWLGDADYATVPVDYLTSKGYARRLARNLDADTTHDHDSIYGATLIPDDAGTSHFCVVDRWGNVVVSTETINTSFGSLAAVDEWGLILNNEMDDFTTSPGTPNSYGLTQSSRNTIAPSKRPLSSMSPTIVLKDGEPVLLIGASGGPKIISSVLGVLLGVTDFGMTLSESMAAVRVHHQWRPNEIVFDREPPSVLANALTARGHTLSTRRKTGTIQAIALSASQLIGGSDPNKGGTPAGY